MISFAENGDSTEQTTVTEPATALEAYAKYGTDVLLDIRDKIKTTGGYEEAGHRFNSLSEFRDYLMESGTLTNEEIDEINALLDDKEEEQ